MPMTEIGNNDIANGGISDLIQALRSYQAEESQ